MQRTKRENTAASSATCGRPPRYWPSRRLKGFRAPGGANLFFFRKTPGHKFGNRLDNRGGLPAGCLNRDGRAGAGREHHQSHDRGAADALGAPQDPDLGIELLDGLHEFGRGARVQSLLVADFENTHDSVFATCRARLIIGSAVRVTHLPVRTRLAMVTYLRPASWAAATASWSGHSSRILASLTSIGRLMPARTSTLGRLITEMARFEGVPPNISVRIATPSPVSTRLTASMMSLRRCSTSSSGPIVTASICCWGPTTRSSAERNSTASRPCVTSTSPIMEWAAGTSRLHRTKAPSS